jgi:DNA-binding transcriptional MerR regulator/effector-binding domain-containing protein
MSETFEDEEVARIARRKGMLPIGQFSRITGLTLKTIRLYHEKELLPPSWVDRDSGYRYYTERDVERARVIADLKELDLPLDEIKGLLDGYDDDKGVLRFLETQRARIEARRDNLGRVARRLDELIRAERDAAEIRRTAPREVVLKDLPSVLVAGLRWRGRYAETGVMLGRVCRKFGRHAVDAPLNLYYDEDYREEDADVESCIPVRPVDEAQGFTVHTLVGGPALSLLHRGPYSELSRSYTRIMSAMQERGLEGCAPVREIYRKGPGMLFKGNPKSYLTEIQILVVERETGKGGA